MIKHKWVKSSMIIAYYVMGPDGIPTRPGVFKTETDAEREIDRFCERYKEQGYYSGVYRRIPLEELPAWLHICTTVVPRSTRFDPTP